MHDGARGDDEAAVGALGDAAALVADQDGRGAVGRVAVHLQTGKGGQMSSSFAHMFWAQIGSL